jgi:hypothetical protein
LTNPSFNQHFRPSKHNCAGCCYSFASQCHVAPTSIHSPHTSNTEFASVGTLPATLCYQRFAYIHSPRWWECRLYIKAPNCFPVPSHSSRHAAWLVNAFRFSFVHTRIFPECILQYLFLLETQTVICFADLHSIVCRPEDYWIGYKLFCYAFYSHSIPHVSEFRQTKLGSCHHFNVSLYVMRMGLRLGMAH